jgi:endonuclease YncB( thermonuclease family)
MRHYSPKHRIRSRAIWIAAFTMLCPALAHAQTCPRAEQHFGAVAKIHPRLDIEIADGRRIHPIHLAPFEATPRGAAHAARARAALESWTKTAGLALPQHLPLADRWGRILTSAFLPSGEDLGLKLVAEGLARVGPSETDPCLVPLLAAEIKARNAKLGLWADSYYSVLAASQPAALWHMWGNLSSWRGWFNASAKPPPESISTLGPRVIVT